MLHAMATIGIGSQWDNWLLSRDRELGAEDPPEHQKPQLLKSPAFPQQFPFCSSPLSIQNAMLWPVEN